MGWTGVVTDAGMALLAQWSGGGHTLTLTKANVGSGTVDAEDLHAATNISSYQANASIVNAKDVGSGMKFKLQVGPSSGSAYTAHQIGIWGKLDSGAETLISIHQDSDTGVSVPAASTSADFAFVLYVTLAISNSEDLTVTLDSAAYVSQSDLNDAVDALEKVATSSANGMMSATDKAKLDGIATGANKYVHPSYTTQTGKPTADQTPGFGGTFTVSQITSDAQGHVTGATDRTVKIPNTAASIESDGLMSKEMYYTFATHIGGTPWVQKTSGYNTTNVASGSYSYTQRNRGVSCKFTLTTKIDITPGQQVELFTLPSTFLLGDEPWAFLALAYKSNPSENFMSPVMCFFGIDGKVRVNTSGFAVTIPSGTVIAGSFTAMQSWDD